MNKEEQEVLQEKLMELIKILGIGDDIVFDCEYGVFKIIRLEENPEC